MTRKSNDGVYLRRRTWWLDFQHEGKRYQFRLGRGISKTVAKELARAKRGEVLKGEAGLSPKRHDLDFDKAAKIFVGWADEQAPEDGAVLRGLLATPISEIWQASPQPDPSVPRRILQGKAREGRRSRVREPRTRDA